MSNMQPRHVFISYVREDKDLIDRICHDFDAKGVKYWLDRNDIKPGARWKDAIREAIRYGDFFLACFSENYTSKTKTYMNEELTLAIDELRQFASDREWFIPVLLSECDVPARSIGAGETLLDINWVTLYDDWAAGMQKLMFVIKPITPNIQVLMYALHSEDDDVRSSAAKALGKIGPDAAEAVPALIQVLEDEYFEVRSSAAKALGKIGPKTTAVVPALLHALEDEDEDENVRRRAAYAFAKSSAAEALGKIGPETIEVVPALIHALEDKDFEVRSSAAKALGKIGPKTTAV